MTRLIIGAMVRAIGAYPSGWRYPGAHRDPRGDAAVLRRAAEVAEAARLDYLFFGDWLATGHDLEFRDPYLVARIDPISAITYLAGITEPHRAHRDGEHEVRRPLHARRATASIDLLSGGRAGLNLVTGAEPRAAGNHGQDFHAANETRYDRAVEFEHVLRRLWDSFEDDAIVADAAHGRVPRPGRLHATDFHGAHLSVTGPLNVARPVQGHLPDRARRHLAALAAVRRAERRPRPRGGERPRARRRDPRGAARRSRSSRVATTAPSR